MEELELEASERGEVVLLPRDPERGYVYWSWPGEEKAGGPARLVLLSGEGDEEVTSFEVREARGGRFVRFGRPGAGHRTRLEWSQGALESESVEAPRREPGQEEAVFVKVEWKEEGMEASPAAHEDEIHGSFPAAEPRAEKPGAPTAPTSTEFHR